MVFGFYELYTEPRMCTGRARLVTIPYRKRSTVKREIRKRVAVGALIWADSFSSYKWLGKAGSGYKWDRVNHSLGEFAKGDYPNRVSTNAVAGLFERVKAFNKKCGIGNLGKQTYGHYLGHFLWHETTLSFSVLVNHRWRDFAFLSFVRNIGFHFL